MTFEKLMSLDVDGRQIEKGKTEYSTARNSNPKDECCDRRNGGSVYGMVERTLGVC